MTLIDKLPLIRGWAWRITPIPVTVTTNQEIMIYQAPTPTKEVGWLGGLDITGDDAFLGLRIVMPGVDTGYQTFFTWNTIGAVLPPPSGGFVTRYWQPNPLRTFGLYSMSLITTAYQWPYYGAVRLYLSLRLGSTEMSASAIVSLIQIVIEDRGLFLKDLRKVYYGRWAPLMDLIDHVPILSTFTRKFEELGIKFEAKEIVEPPGIAR